MNRRHFTRSLVLGAAASALPYQAHAASTSMLVYFGPYTNAKSGSKGIYRATFDSATGTLTDPVLAAETASPSFLEIHPSKKYLYAVGEMGDAKQKGGAVSAFAISLPSGDLKLINQVSSVGAGPCHVNIDKTGKVAGVANYGSGSCASYQIKDDGSLSEAASFHQHAGPVADAKRQKGPHAHSVNYSPDGRFAFVCDLGLDKVFIYKVDTTTGKFESHGEGIVPPRSGPRHLAWHPSGKYLFVNNEILLTCTVFAYDADKGALTTLDSVSCLPKDQAWEARFSTAETRVHPNGKFVYVSCRTHDTIARFSFDEATGKLTHLGNTPSGGKIPRNFNITPDGQWLLCAHQDSGNIVVFRVDAATGDLRATGKEVHVGGCVCIRFLALD
jgi:6-phosphogluconolactonase